MFYLQVETGNDGVSCAEDLGDILKMSAEAVKLGANEGKLKDCNGNVVGEWGYTPNDAVQVYNPESILASTS